MSENILHQAQQIARNAERETLAQQYREAVDAGDFDISGEIMERAETDLALFELLEEVHKQMIAEDGIVFSDEEIERAQIMILHNLRQYFEEWQ